MTALIRDAQAGPGLSIDGEPWTLRHHTMDVVLTFQQPPTPARESQIADEIALEFDEYLAMEIGD